MLSQLALCSAPPLGAYLSLLQRAMLAIVAAVALVVAACLWSSISCRFELGLVTRRPPDAASADSRHHPRGRRADARAIIAAGARFAIASRLAAAAARLTLPSSSPLPHTSPPLVALAGLMIRRHASGLRAAVALPPLEPLAAERGLPRCSDSAGACCCRGASRGVRLQAGAFVSPPAGEAAGGEPCRRCSRNQDSCRSLLPPQCRSGSALAGSSIAWPLR